MQVCSTRDRGARLSFSASLLAGLPPGGGLYQPDPVPDLRREIAALPERASFREVAAAMTARLFAEELASSPAGPDAAARDVAEAAFPFAPALSWLHDDLALLELFHGPTCAFKDFGASFLATLLERQLRTSPDGPGVVVLVATSGDTGGAVARAFWRRSGIEVVLLYPSGRISRLQEQQLTALGDNVHALEVAGSFDDCQRLVKAALADEELAAAARLCPANSISLGRLLPQAFYYLFAGVRLRSGGRPLFCVPSGNFGNLTAGVYAAWWGLPVAGFLAATNRNDVVPRYLDTGELSPHPSFATLSNAMDVGDPSNFERILARFEHDHAAVRDRLRGCSVSDADTLATMRDVHRHERRLVDPHTAVGIAAARRLRASGGVDAGTPLVVLATADAGKFPETVRRATGVEPPIPPSLQELLTRPKQATPMEPRSAALRAFILERATASG
ncbi:MAG: threonine synthase [Spirochaetaceae bacterium]|nr:threonine synthase [Spirochaetaceae bacterium]